MSNICLITGDHPRHKFFAETLAATGQISSWVVESREEFIPKPTENLNSELKNLFIHHFNERDRIENMVFCSDRESISLPTHKVNLATLNDDETIKFVNQFKPKLVISYGCHKLSTRFMDNIPARFWNTHGGLSPEYRGVITHFWPSYFLEPQMTGMTLHETTNFIDGGEVIFQSAAPMVYGDSLHRLAARNVEMYSHALASKLNELDFFNLPRGQKQSGYGKVFMSKDWRPEHLHLIYNLYEDRIVDAVISGQLTGREPNLVDVL